MLAMLVYVCEYSVLLSVLGFRPTIAEVLVSFNCTQSSPGMDE